MKTFLLFIVVSVSAFGQAESTPLGIYRKGPKISVPKYAGVDRMNTEVEITYDPPFTAATIGNPIAETPTDPADICHGCIITDESDDDAVVGVPIPDFSSNEDSGTLLKYTCPPDGSPCRDMWIEQPREQAQHHGPRFLRQNDRGSAMSYLDPETNKFVLMVEINDYDASYDGKEWFHLLGRICLRSLAAVEVAPPSNGNIVLSSGPTFVTPIFQQQVKAKVEKQ